MELREKFYSEFNERLVSSGYESEDIRTISNCLLLALDKYELSERCTALSVPDTTNEKLIKSYLCSFLTEGNSKKSAKGYMSILKRFADDIDKPLTEVNAIDCRIWLAKFQEKGLSLTTCNNYRSYLYAFYTWLTTEDIIPKNPMLSIKPIKVPKKAKKAFKEVEIDKLRSNCDTLRDRAELEMLYATGARASELSNLNIDDIDINTNEVTIREGKGKKDRVVYISELAKYHLEQYLNSRHDELPYLFVTKCKTRVSKDILERDMKRIGLNADIKKVHPHKFRRTLATVLNDRGMDIRSVQTILGHANLNTTMNYISVNNSRVKTQYDLYIR